MKFGPHICIPVKMIIMTVVSPQLSIKYHYQVTVYTNKDGEYDLLFYFGTWLFLDLKGPMVKL